MVVFVSAAIATLLWANFAVSPTIGSAVIAAAASVVNTGLLIWHDRRSSARIEARRMVVTKIGDGHDDDAETVVVTPEDRRQLADRRKKPKSRKLHERRRRKRRD